MKTTAAGDTPDPRNPEPSEAGPPAGRLRIGELRRHVRAFLGAVARAPNSRKVYVLVAAVTLVIAATTFGQIRLNEWQRDFYDALEQRHFDALLVQLGVFVTIIAGLLTLQVAQTWLGATLKIGLRDAVTTDLLSAWMQPRRAYQLGWAGDVGHNPDQRIQEDARHLCDLCGDLGIGLLQATLLLVSFVGVLWVLSEHVTLVYDGYRLEVPGYMVWCAVAYAAAGSWATWRVGKPLVPLNAEHYAREADFRFSLVHTNEAAEAIGLNDGEVDTRNQLGTSLGRVLAIQRQIARGLANLTWVTAGYGWLALVVPIVVAAPGYFGGTLTFGELMMVTGAFFQVQQSLRWFVDNFAAIADWRATLLRVMSLRLALPDLEPMGVAAGHIVYQAHPDGRLALEDLVVALPDKQVGLADGRFELAPGDRVLITGGPGRGKSMLFRAIAGLWPWGSGRVLLPPADRTVFLPQRPYLPIGTLRKAIAYPRAPEGYSDSDVKAALDRVGLAHLVRHLDEERRWDRELAVEEQQALAFSRLLLQRPLWVFLDNPLNALEGTRRAELMTVFQHELADAAVLAVGRSTAAAPPQCQAMELVEIPSAERAAS
ncbi:MAG: ABC transporter ATP-binding protein/permease [Thalassobaculum sp.]|uniref:ABC transporter ATP-binding protein/permease n=1 Tax=Thalassobaculum sp. TaxID=2022740 RepID=UPI0032ECD880